MPQNSNFRLPRGHRFFAKNGSYGYGAKSRWRPPRVHLGANGVPLGKKRVKTVKNNNAPKIRISDDPAVIDFSQKMEFTVMAPNHGGDPLGAILGPLGSHWVQKMGQNVENYLAQNSNFRRPRGHRFFPKNGSYGYGVKSWWGPPMVHLGANRVQLGKKKWVKTVKNYHAPKFEFWLPRVYRFFPKNGSFGYSAKSQWGPPRVHLGANGVPLGKKNGSKP